LQEKKSTGWPGWNVDVNVIRNGVEVILDPQDVGFNEQWLTGTAKLIRYQRCARVIFFESEWSQSHKLFE